MHATTTRPPANADRFFQDLKAVVAADLERRGLRSDGGRFALLKSAALLLHCAFWYAAWLVALTHGLGWALLTLIPFVFAMVVLDTGVFHDASHGALHRNRFVNGAAKFVIRVFGASAISWHNEHVVKHHGHTNVHGLDTDLESGGFLRFHPSQPLKPWHRYQQFYAWALYGVVILRWVWFEDFDDLIRNAYRMKPRERLIHAVEILASKAFHAFAFIVVPCWAGGIAAGLGTYVLAYAMFGVVVSSIFVVAHLSAVQELAHARSDLPLDWGRMQLATTANFGAHQRWLGFLIGGLNHQVEHHLFPTISHRHYASLSPVVREFCRARGVPYLEYPSFPAALQGHFRHLKQLGAQRAVTFVPQLAKATT